MQTELLPAQAGFFVVGKPGTGKKIVASSLITAALASDRPVVVFDRGESYRHLAQLLMGATIQPTAGPVYDLERPSLDHPLAGVMPPPLQFVVFDFSRAEDRWEDAMPWSALDWDAFAAAGGLVVVDELPSVMVCLPYLRTLMPKLVAAGASFCLVGQSRDALAEFKGLSSATSRWIELTTVSPEARLV